MSEFSFRIHIQGPFPVYSVEREQDIEKEKLFPCPGNATSYSATQIYALTALVQI